MSRVTATDRVQRILAVVPWILQNQGTTVAQICERFGMTRKALIDDLEFVFYNVGLHPFTPDMLAEVTIADDRVTIHVGDYFRRPLRLTHEEALSLLAAGRAMEARPGTDPEGPLPKAVQKLAAALGPAASSAVAIELGGADPRVFESVQLAVDEHRELRLRYYSFGRDEVSSRLIQPFRLLAREGHWYLLARCHTAGGERLFRVDRIESAELEDTVFEPPTEGAETSFDLVGPCRTVVLVVPGSQSWIASSYPCDEVEELSDGTLRIALPVTTTRWLERLLVRLGPEALVWDRDSGEKLDHLRSEVAQRLLSRYLADDGGDPDGG